MHKKKMRIIKHFYRQYQHKLLCKSLINRFRKLSDCHKVILFFWALDTRPNLVIIFGKWKIVWKRDFGMRLNLWYIIQRIIVSICAVLIHFKLYWINVDNQILYNLIAYVAKFGREMVYISGIGRKVANLNQSKKYSNENNLLI